MLESDKKILISALFLNRFPLVDWILPGWELIGP